MRGQLGETTADRDRVREMWKNRDCKTQKQRETEKREGGREGGRVLKTETKKARKPQRESLT